MVGGVAVSPIEIPSLAATPKPAPVPTPSIIGLDLGQANDYTALIVAQPDDADPPAYDIGHIERVPLKTRYPEIVSHVGKVVGILSTPPKPESGQIAQPPKPRVSLIVDYTGVGRPVLDMFLEAQADGAIDPDCDIVPVTITGGERVRWDDAGVHVPKRELASAVQRGLQEGRIRIPRNHPMAQALTEELTGFRVKVSLSGKDSYGAGEDWRSAAHDDLVLSLALAIWFGDVTAESGR
jgi:hypothetical protein